MALDGRPPVDLDAKRCFSKGQRLKIFERANGRCEVELGGDGNPTKPGEKGRRCNRKVRGKWIAGHILPHHLGGRTEVSNGRVECSACSKMTAANDKGIAAKIAKKAGKKGQYAQRNKHGPKMKGRGFPGHRKFNGDIVWKL